ncbi:chemotaxis protein CheB [Paenibacillus eucommiae]|uniref:protein-glutamate methylesterase n=1 Tax=Paenibacillus eucommiae TaxID=1355755 RepID=A0ABS4J726_9BACL|nr:chemotaxis protein CheB [Paenibacillus eucommiae]MBP1995645.1 two-component system chemotaxis response regulator CheB [Paenibacillus eucommiae]
MSRYEAVVIGVSAGGLKALSDVLSYLPRDYLLPVLIVQHLLDGSDNFLAEYLNEQTAVHVKEADEKELIRPGYVYLAPAGYHLLIEEDRTISLSVDPRVNYSRPSIDVLFESAAYVFEERCVGVILTGANSDGSVGLSAIHKKGGLTVVQDPKTAEYNMMPDAAIQATKVDHILSLAEIGKLLSGLGWGTGSRIFNQGENG